ncbi:MAG: DUF4124 domain-containing protein [Panacagrimonas sp.]
MPLIPSSMFWSFTWPAVVLIGSLASTATLAAEVYRHVDQDGVVHYSDQPPTKGAKPIVLPPIQVVGPLGGPTAGSSPAAAAVVDPDMTGAAPLSVSIMSPTADETFRGDDRLLPVSVRMNQPLPDGYGLLYLLDGAAQNAEPTRALNHTLEGVERGEHTVVVATVDGSGREVARTAPVIVHMKPPTVQLTQDRKKPPAKPDPRPRGPVP